MKMPIITINNIEKEKQINFYIKPYQTLLLNSNIKIDDLTDKIKNFISLLNPLKSLAQIALDSNQSLTIVLKLAQHLYDWNKVKVIPTITKNTLIVLSLLIPPSRPL